MSANAWLIVAIVGFSLSGAALITAAVLFFKLNIPGVIGDLTGKTVAREIEAIRQANASNETKVSRKLADSGKYAASASASYMAKAHASKRLDRTESASEPDASRTHGSRHFTEDLSAQGSQCAVRATEVLTPSVLEELGENVEMQVEKNGTTVLNAEPEQMETPARAVIFKVTRSKVVTHSDQVIK